MLTTAHLSSLTITLVNVALKRGDNNYTGDARATVRWKHPILQFHSGGVSDHEAGWPENLRQGSQRPWACCFLWSVLPRPGYPGILYAELAFLNGRTTDEQMIWLV
jgi:hypothetical protein